MNQKYVSSIQNISSIMKNSSGEVSAYSLLAHGFVINEGLN